MLGPHQVLTQALPHSCHQRAHSEHGLVRPATPRAPEQIRTPSWACEPLLRSVLRPPRPCPPTKTFALVWLPHLCSTLSPSPLQPACIPPLVVGGWPRPRETQDTGTQMPVVLHLNWPPGGSVAQDRPPPPEQRCWATSRGKGQVPRPLRQGRRRWAKCSPAAQAAKAEKLTLLPGALAGLWWASPARVPVLAQAPPRPWGCRRDRGGFRPRAAELGEGILETKTLVDGGRNLNAALI